MSSEKSFKEYLVAIGKFVKSRKIILPAVLFLIFLRIIAIPYIGTFYKYRAGEIAREEIYAKRDIIYTDIEKTKFKHNEVKRTISPLFVYYPDAVRETQQRLKKLFDFLKKQKAERAPVRKIIRDINRNFRI